MRSFWVIPLFVITHLFTALNRNNTYVNIPVYFNGDERRNEFMKCGLCLVLVKSSVQIPTLVCCTSYISLQLCPVYIAKDSVNKIGGESAENRYLLLLRV